MKTNLLFINLGKELGTLDKMKNEIETKLNEAIKERPLNSFEVGVMKYQFQNQFDRAMKIIIELGIEDKVNLVEYTDYINILELLYTKIIKKEEYVKIGTH